MSRVKAIAQFVTYDRRFAVATHPFLVASISLSVLVVLSQVDMSKQIAWLMIGVMVCIVPLIAMVRVNVDRGVYQSPEVIDRKEREDLYVMGSVLMIVFLLSAYLFDAPDVVQRGGWAGLLGLAIAGLVSKFFDSVTVHSLTLSGNSVILFLFNPIVGLIMGLLTLLIGSARVYTGRHTLRQVALGWLIGFGVVGTVFMLG